MKFPLFIVLGTVLTAASSGYANDKTIDQKVESAFKQVEICKEIVANKWSLEDLNNSLPAGSPPRSKRLFESFKKGLVVRWESHGKTLDIYFTEFKRGVDGLRFSIEPLAADLENCLDDIPGYRTSQE
jgi:hypothetical protein